jgi:glucan phosphorylase
MQALKTQLLLKKIITKQDWETWKEEIVFDFIEDNYFSELKESEMIRERFEMLASLDEYVGKYVSNEWIRKQILRQSDEDIKEIDGQIEKESEEDGEDLDLDI